MKQLYFLLFFLFLYSTMAAQDADMPFQYTLHFQGDEREYFIQHPRNIDPDKTYWLLIVVHGGGGNGKFYWLANGIKKAMEDQPIEAIMVTPSFSNTDVQASRFPQLGEGAFLIKVIEELKNKYKVHDKILLTGYSRGGQFTHRFALQHPELVKACAPFAAGTWTTSEGTLLMEGLEEINDPETFLNDATNTTLVPERLKGMFGPRVAKVAGISAKQHTASVPFFVMCGTLDPRFEIARNFAASLKANGYRVQTSWPKTPHGGRDEYPEEFQKYAIGALSFFTDEIEK